MIRYARPDEKRKTFEWLYCSDTTHMHSGAPNFSENPIADWEQFCNDFEDFYFEQSGRLKGAVMVIEEELKEIGNVCYSLFHLNQGIAELDIWINSELYINKGYGTKALSGLTKLLHNELNIRRFIIRPSTRNEQAIRAYEKVGFQKVKNADEVICEYLKSEYREMYAAGDYGEEGTATLILEL